MRKIILKVNKNDYCFCPFWKSTTNKDILEFDWLWDIITQVSPTYKLLYGKGLETFLVELAMSNPEYFEIQTRKGN